MAQTCRVCGVHVPSGFTNCDGCYYKTDEAKAEEIDFLKHISNLESLASTGQGPFNLNVKAN